MLRLLALSASRSKSWTTFGILPIAREASSREEKEEKHPSVVDRRGGHNLAEHRREITLATRAAKLEAKEGIP